MKEPFGYVYALLLHAIPEIEDCAPPIIPSSTLHPQKLQNGDTAIAFACGTAFSHLLHRQWHPSTPRPLWGISCRWATNVNDNPTECNHLHRNESFPFGVICVDSHFMYYSTAEMNAKHWAV